MTSPLGILFDDRFKLHVNPPGHPERPGRLDAVAQGLASRSSRGAASLAAVGVADEDLLRVHTSEYLARLRSNAGRRVSLDPDTSMCPDSYEVARLAAGSVVRAADAVVAGEVHRAAVFLRPPGHHAEADRAMGFCLFNNVAVAAAHALARGARRVLVVDYDVHHGNGTQHIFERDPRVLYVSTHQFPWYPGTGALDEIGRGPGEGFTVNLPLPAGCGDSEYEGVFSRLIVPIATEFVPDLVLVSAGFDAHAADPLGGMRVSAAGFARMTAMLRDAADAVSGQRLVLVLEGGYNLEALAECTARIVDVLHGDPVPGLTALRPAEGFSALLSRFSAAHGRFWRSIIQPKA